MKEGNYSEDYKKLMFYKQNTASENSEKIEEETTLFFFSKYEDLIKKQYKFLCDKVSKEAIFKGKMDAEEVESFSISTPSEENFYNLLINKYIPQALESFNPEKITNKNAYCFATYMYNYLRHAVRDGANNWFKLMSVCANEKTEISLEEKIEDNVESEIIREKYAELRKQLDSLELQILDLLIEGKKQNEMILMNKKTGNAYTKGYVSKIVKRIRLKMRRLLETK